MDELIRIFFEFGLRFAVLYFISDVMAKFVLVLIRLIFGEFKGKTFLILTIINLVFMIGIYFINGYFYSIYQIKLLYTVATYIWLHGMFFTFNFGFHGFIMSVKR